MFEKPRPQGTGNNDTIWNDIIMILAELIIGLGGAIFWLLAEICKKMRERYQNSKGDFTNHPLEIKHLKSNRVKDYPALMGKSLNRKRDFKYYELDSTTHTGVFGSTGSGKSVLLETLVDRSLYKNLPVIFFDPKPGRESIERFKRICEKHNKAAYIFSPLERNSIQINPLRVGSVDENVAKIMNSLTWSEVYYKNACEQAVRLCLDKIANLDEVPTISKILTILEAFPNQKDIGSLKNQLSSLNSSIFGALINPDSTKSLSYEDIREGKQCLYIGIPSIGIGSSGNILNKLLFGDLLRHTTHILSERMDESTYPISVFFDELSGSVHEGFIDLQNKCRAAKLELYYATQCPSDLDRINKEFKNQVMENTNNLFVFNQVVPAHTDLFSSIAGTKTVMKETFVAEDGRRSGKSSQRETESMIAHPNIFRELKVGQCVFIQRKPSKRVDILAISMKADQKPYKREMDRKKTINPSLFRDL